MAAASDTGSNVDVLGLFIMEVILATAFSQDISLDDGKVNLLSTD